MPGNPKSPNPSQRSPYVKVKINGHYYNSQGMITKRNAADSHIPARNFNMKKFNEIING